MVWRLPLHIFLYIHIYLFILNFSRFVKLLQRNQTLLKFTWHVFVLTWIKYHFNLCSFMCRKPELLFPLKMNYEFQSQHIKHYNLYFLSSQNGLKLLFRLQKLPNWRWIMNFHSMVFCKNVAIQQSWNRFWNQNYFLDCARKIFSNYILLYMIFPSLK